MCLCFGRAIFFVEMHPSVFASQSLARKTGPTSPRGTGCCLSDGSFIIFFNLNAGETISLQETIFPGLLSACIFFFQPSGDGCCARIACYKGLRRPTSASSCSYSSRAYGSFTAKGSSAFSGTICSQRVRSLRRVRRVQIAGMF
jgi:hypothetical protein